MESRELEFKQLLYEQAAKEKRAQRNSVIYLLVPLIIGVLWLWFSIQKVQVLQKQSSEMEQKVATLSKELDSLRAETKDLTQTQEDVLDFLAKVTSKQQFKLIDDDVNWDQTKGKILSLQRGSRKQAVLGSILLAWKDIPFNLGHQSLSSGFDSPRFVRYVLSQVGVKIADEPKYPLSVTMMRRFKETKDPLPGDLMFYKGAIGNFVMIYLADGKPEGNGVCVGTFETGQPVQIMDSSNLNTAYYPFLGYYRVDY